MREREREAETQAEGEAGSTPDVGLDPRTPGSRPGPKAGAKPLSHPEIPHRYKYKEKRRKEGKNVSPRDENS